MARSFTRAVRAPGRLPKTFATEFNLHHGSEKMKFAGRTDVSLVREFFGIHRIAATPENFRRFFERYVFWLDHIVAQSNGDACHRRAGNSFTICTHCRSRRCSACSPAISGSARKSSCAASTFGISFESGAFADDHEDRNQIAVAALERGSRVLGKKLRGEEILVIGDTPFDIRCGKFIGAKVLAVATGGATLDELKNHRPDWAVENLTQISAREICAAQVEINAQWQPPPQHVRRSCHRLSAG